MKTQGSRDSQAACSWSEQVWGSQVPGSRCLFSWSPSFPGGPAGEAAAFVCCLFHASNLLLFAVCGLDLLNHPWSLLRNAGRGFFQPSWSWPLGILQAHIACTVYKPWLLHVSLILLLSPGQPPPTGESLHPGLPACHVFLFIYPLSCLFHSVLPKTTAL